MLRAPWWIIPRQLVWLGTSTLIGCGVVTGPGFDSPDSTSRTSVTLGSYVPGDVSRRPAQAVIPITPQLIEAELSPTRSAVPLTAQRLFGDAQPYTIAPSDVIGITVYDHPELNPAGTSVIGAWSDPTGISSAPGFIVNFDGYISYPFIGRVKVAGLTDIQASEMLAKHLSKFIREPQVSVRIQSFRSRRVYVEGEVRSPGTQIVTDIPMTVAEALFRAGGVAAQGDRSNIVLNREGESITLNLLELQAAGIDLNRLMLRNGDVLTVRNRDESKVYVLGEVRRPSALSMNNGRLSLNQALSESGGPQLTTANTSQIYVIRNAGAKEPLVFHLNASVPTALALADNFQLRPRDVVYVDPVPLVRWNRIISLIMPSARAISAGENLLD